MRWEGKDVYVYPSNIRRLAELAGFEGSGQELIVKLTFVNGFPESIFVTFQQLSNLKTLEISELVSTANVLTTKSLRK